MVTAVKERFYSVPEVADVLGLHPNTIRRMIQRGELDHVRVTRWIRVTEYSLNEYMDKTGRKRRPPVSRRRPGR